MPRAHYTDAVAVPRCMMRGKPLGACRLEVTMTRYIHRSLLIAAAGLMVALPVGLSVAEQSAVPDRAQRTPMPGPMPYAAQKMPCAARSDVVKMLREQFGETPVAHGLAHTGAVAEVFLGPKGTWTIVATSPQGLSCMVGSGENWAPQVAHDDTI